MIYFDNGSIDRGVTSSLTLFEFSCFYGRIELFLFLIISTYRTVLFVTSIKHLIQNYLGKLRYVLILELVMYGTGTESILETFPFQ